jgi:hypothetical protein
MICKSDGCSSLLQGIQDIPLNSIRVHPVDQLNQRLQALIAEACTHPPKSFARRERLSEIYRLVMQSGKLWRSREQYYNDALQEMWEFCCQNPELYDPQVKRVITWLDDELKKRLRRIRSAKYRDQQRFPTWQTEAGESFDLLSLQAANPDMQPVHEIEQTTLKWIEIDPETITQAWLENNLAPVQNPELIEKFKDFKQRLHQTCFRKRCDMDCAALFLKRFPLETQWDEIAAMFQLNAAEAKDLPKFYSRSCIPLLREFAALQGYIDTVPATNRQKKSSNR